MRQGIQTQSQPGTPATTTDKTEDNPEPNRFWQASVGGGHYMVALDRISSVSRHKYSAGWHGRSSMKSPSMPSARRWRGSTSSRPVTDAVTGNSAGNAASRIVDRGRELIDKAADDAGTDIHNMVVKKFPETTHAHTIEYRVLSAEELTGLYNSVRTAWETGRGRKFTVK